MNRGHALRAGEVGVRHEPAQAPLADLRRASSTRCGPRPRSADPAKVLLDRLAVAGEAGAARSVVGRGVPRSRSGRRCRVVADAPPRRPRSARRDDDPVRVRDHGVAQLDLEPDDRVEPDRLGRADETDHAIQAVVVRDGQPGQPEFDGPLDEVVRRARRRRGTRSWCGSGVRRTGRSPRVAPVGGRTGGSLL